MKMERFYLQVTGDNATIMHRPTHELIGFLDIKTKGDKKEAKEKLISLINMSTEEFYNYLLEHEVRLPKWKCDTDIAHDKEHEEWLQNAWSFTTKKLFEDLEITKEVPKEDYPFSLVQELKLKSNSNRNVDKANNKKLKIKANKPSIDLKHGNGHSSSSSKSLKSKLKLKRKRLSI